MATQILGSIILWLIALAVIVVIAVYLLRWLYRPVGWYVARNLTFYHPAIQNSQQMISPDIAVFSFGLITIGGGTVSIAGTRPIAILSRTDISIVPNLSVSGSTGSISGGAGGAGGV